MKSICDQYANEAPQDWGVRETVSARRGILISAFSACILLFSAPPDARSSEATIDFGAHADSFFGQGAAPNGQMLRRTAFGKVSNPAPPGSDVAVDRLDHDEAAELMNLAVVGGDGALLNAIVEAGFPVDIPDADGWTPLMTAVLFAHTEMVRLLVEAGAEPSLETRGGLSALTIARNQGSRDILALFGDRGEPRDTWIPLLVAAERGDSSLVQEVLAQGVQPDASREDGRTSLMLAVRSGDARTVTTLLEAGASVDSVSADGSTALLLAIQGAEQELVELLLEYGANPNGPTFAVMPPLAAALFQGDAHTAHRLLDADSIETIWRSGGEETPLQELARRAGLPDVALRIEALQRGPEPFDPALAFAKLLELDDASGLEELLNSGQLDPNVRLDIHGVTPLMAVTLYEPYRGAFVKRLLEAGVDVSLQDVDGRNVFHHAAMAGQAGAIWEILRASDTVASYWVHDVPDTLGRTPLHYAIASNSFWGVSALATSSTLSRPRANIHHVDQDGISPLTLAVLLGDENILEELLSRDETPRLHAEKGAVSLHDIARHRGDFSMLSILPYDRILVVSGNGALTAEERKRVQEQLKDWGFYGGAIDGIWGAGTYAALNAFFREQREELTAILEVVKASSGRSKRGPKSSWSIRSDVEEGKTVQLHYEPNHRYEDLPHQRYYFQTVYRANGRSREDDYTYIGPFSFQGANWGLHWRWWGGAEWEIGLYRRDRPSRGDDRWPERESLHVGGRS